jgi:hypothetical protein
MNPALTLDDKERYSFERDATTQRMIPLLQIRHLVSRKKGKSPLKLSMNKAEEEVLPLLEP